MSSYSIKDLEQLTGVMAHTIRIWEKRYQVVTPKRTETNIRYYSDEDLKKLINTSFLNKRGYKISKIAQLSNEQLKSEIAQLTMPQSDTEAWVESFTIAMIDLDESHLEELYQQAAKRYTFEAIALTIFYPLLERIGVMWQIDKIIPAHEHLVSHFIRNKIIAATAALPYPSNNTPRAFILFLQEDEYHEIGLLFANYMVKKKGIKTIYLGQSVPFTDLLSVAKSYPKANFISFFTHHKKQMKLSDFATQFCKHLPNSQLLAMGCYAHEFTEFKQIAVVNNMDELTKQLV
jgi:DNA-binding transcriptional MerR regulator